MDHFEGGRSVSDLPLVPDKERFQPFVPLAHSMPAVTRDDATERRILLSDEFSRDTVARALRLPFHAGIEATDMATFEGEASLVPSAEESLFLSLTTVSAYAIDLSSQFCAALGERIEISSAVRDGIETVLHECVVNAIVHGNLEVNGVEASTIEGLGAITSEIDRRIGAGLWNSRRLRVALHWDSTMIEAIVQDEGRGYDPAKIKQTSDAMASGRGLNLIRQMTTGFLVEDGGRCHRLRFCR